MEVSLYYHLSYSACSYFFFFLHGMSPKSDVKFALFNQLEWISLLIGLIFCSDLKRKPCCGFSNHDWSFLVVPLVLGMFPLVQGSVVLEIMLELFTFCD